MGAEALQELTRCFQAAVYATTETEMRAKWHAVMQVSCEVVPTVLLQRSSLGAAVLAYSVRGPVMPFEVFDTTTLQSAQPGTWSTFCWTRGGGRTGTVLAD
jgi:hypothetical protein